MRDIELGSFLFAEAVVIFSATFEMRRSQFASLWVVCYSYLQQQKGELKMGSRTTWKVITNDDAAIWLYSHWGGESKFVDTQNALVAAMPRWDDRTYGARIFTSNIVRENWSEETGFGITATLIDAECPFEESYFNAVIDFTTQTVTMGSQVWSFSGFITAIDCSEELVAEFYGEVLA